MAVAPIPGFSADGLSIENPTLFLQSILPRINPTEPPTIQKATATPMLIDPTGENIKFFEKIQIPYATRISSSAYNNCCWFDSFLYCMIPEYRATSITNRIPIFQAFRKWCVKHADQILKEAPTFMNKEGLSDAIPFFKENVGNLTSEIDSLSGFLIAWYFGVNLIYVNQPYKGIYALVCETAYQSPDCKVILMNLSQGSVANHYEPIGIVYLNTKNQLDENDSTFMFDWKEEGTQGYGTLCYLKHFKEHVCDKSELKYHANWKYPKTCPKEILDYSTKKIEKFKTLQTEGESTSTRRIKIYGQTVASLLDKMDAQDQPAFTELIQLAKDGDSNAIKALKMYTSKLQKEANTIPGAKNVLNILNKVKGGKRKTRVVSKRHKIKKTRRSNTRII